MYPVISSLSKSSLSSTSIESWKDEVWEVNMIPLLQGDSDQPDKTAENKHVFLVFNVCIDEYY